MKRYLMLTNNVMVGELFSKFFVFTMRVDVLRRRGINKNLAYQFTDEVRSLHYSNQ